MRFASFLKFPACNKFSPSTSPRATNTGEKGDGRCSKTKSGQISGGFLFNSLPSAVDDAESEHTGSSDTKAHYSSGSECNLKTVVQAEKNSVKNKNRSSREGYPSAKLSALHAVAVRPLASTANFIPSQPHPADRIAPMMKEGKILLHSAVAALKIIDCFSNLRGLRSSKAVGLIVPPSCRLNPFPPRRPRLNFGQKLKSENKSSVREFWA